MGSPSLDGLFNAESVGLHEAGSTKVGFKMGAWRDLSLWQLALAELLAGAPSAAPQALMPARR